MRVRSGVVVLSVASATLLAVSGWPPVRGVPKVAHGAKIPGKFGRIRGQVTYNGWPLYLFTGEKPHKNHADSSFKVVRVSVPSKKPSLTPTPNW